MSVAERRNCLNKLVAFAKSVPITYVSFCAEKKHIRDELGLTVALSKMLSAFLKENLAYFTGFDRVVVYYDNGQVELNKILASVFTILLTNVEFRKAYPADYRLFQVADLLCTLELIKRKRETHTLSRSEQIFFGSARDLKKNYLRPLERLRFLK